MSINMLFSLILRMTLFIIWVPDEQFETKGKFPWDGGGAQYAKLDPRLICLICIYSISKAQPAKYRKRINKVN